MRGLCDASSMDYSYLPGHSGSAVWPVPNYTAWRQRYIAQDYCVKADRPRVELATSELQVQCFNHYTTVPHSAAAES